MIWRNTAAVCMLMLTSISFQAHAYCFREAGNAMKVDPLLLLAISIQESRLQSGVVGVNRPGRGPVSYDYGLMQINSDNVKRLFRQYGIDSDLLLKNPCINVYVGAFLLRKNFDQYGANWFSVGAYNAGTKLNRLQAARRKSYANKIQKIYRDLQVLESQGKVNL